MSGPDASSWTIAPQRSLLPAEAKTGVLALLSDHPDSDNAAVNDLTETRWTRYGKDRVYVRTTAGVDVGYIDLHAQTVVPALSEYETVLRHSLARWCPPVETPEPAPPAPLSEVIPVPTRDHSTDLAANIAGAAARAKREEVNAEAPVRNLVARACSV